MLSILFTATCLTKNEWMNNMHMRGMGNMKPTKQKNNKVMLLFGEVRETSAPSASAMREFVCA